ncbi:MAG: ATP synthase subunit I [Polyangiaceae bacterium]
MAAPPRDAIRTTLVNVAAAGLTFGIASIFYKDPRITVSVFIGAAVALLNLWVLSKIVKSLMPETEGAPAREGSLDADGAKASEDEKPKGSWGILAVVKIFALFGGAFALWKSGLALPIPTLIGYGALPIGIVVGQVVPRR